MLVDLEAHVLERLAHDRDENVNHHECHDDRIEREYVRTDGVVETLIEVAIELAHETLERRGERFHRVPVGLELVVEVQVEHLHERHPHEQEHQAEAHELFQAVLESQRQCVDLLVEAEQLEQAYRAQSAAQRQRNC